MLGLHELLNFVLRNVLNIGLAAVQLFDFCRVGVKSGYAMPGFGKAQSQRQSHVPTTNNSNAKLRALEVFRPAIGWHRCLLPLPSNSYFRELRADYSKFSHRRNTGSPRPCSQLPITIWEMDCLQYMPQGVALR